MQEGVEVVTNAACFFAILKILCCYRYVKQRNKMDKIWLKHYQAGVPAQINPDAYPSLNALFEECCARFADKKALSNFGVHLHYRELASLSSLFAAFLQQKLGLKKGDRFAIMLPNSLQYFIALFGALRAGLIVVNVNPLYTSFELAHQVTDAGADSIIVMANFAHTVQEALQLKTPLKNIIVTELGDLFPWPKRWLVNFVVKNIRKAIPKWSIPNATSFRHAMSCARKLSFKPVSLNGNDIAFFQYTGGTTGVPKAAMLSHRNLIANIEQIKAWGKPLLAEGEEIVITPLPLYHIFSLTANALAMFPFGVFNILITNPKDIPSFVKVLKKVPFTLITGVNTLFDALLHNPDFIKLDFSHLKIALGGGTAIQKSVADHWQQVTGKMLYEGYGLTEASPVVCVMPFNLKVQNGSIGLPIPSTDILLRDASGKEVPLGESGELCVKGPQVMQSYWNQPAETNKAFSPDGWLLTGDIARLDEQGFVYLIDRKKDLILVSGFNVYPNEIEDTLKSHPGVQEAAVVGIPDQKTGEAIVAFIVRDDPALTAEELIKFCREHLTGYKIPHQIEFRDTLPKSPVGKVLRRALREEMPG